MNLKRTKTKVGDVFKLTSNEHGSWYLQLIGVDKANMNSDVLAAFHPNEDTNLALTKIVKLPYAFYLHTTSKFGVKQGFWEKVGSESVSINTTALTFKYHRDQDHIEIMQNASERANNPNMAPKYSEPYWDIWALGDQRFHSVSGDKSYQFDAEPGDIFAPRSIVKRIETGRSLF